MLDKKKHHFNQLVVIFGAVAIISLLSVWGYRSDAEVSMSMMGQSMGNMMSTMHAKNITLNDLFIQEEKVEAAVGMESHHNEQDAFLRNSYNTTTAMIVILLPFIVAGSVFLGIVWLK